MKPASQSNASVLEQKIKTPVSLRTALSKGDVFTQSPVAQHPTSEIEVLNNHQRGFRRFLRMLGDHLTNGNMTTYTFYY